ncbi:hypothetical protein CFter6_4466 [Collimonas fungivorans]|uniref:Uncharacterized protein n=1 Tax=Collimonas fungivorans TaxID=158899 RepID=A0A127PGX4_9BURK|nr:hypothetical protein CFter6_4466 [Collimonas fungivorans]
MKIHDCHFLMLIKRCSGVSMNHTFHTAPSRIIEILLDENKRRRGFDGN